MDPGTLARILCTYPRIFNIIAVFAVFAVFADFADFARTYRAESMLFGDFVSLRI
jgi:hypothetical protein